MSSDPPDPTRLVPPPGGAEDRTVLTSDPPTVVLPMAGVPPARRAGVRPIDAGVLINNNYRIQAMLSQGGMGEVYRAENVFTGVPVALKIVLPSLAQDDGIVALFMREARILGQLTDEAVVRYHNFVLDPDLGRYCLIMEYIDGTTLWDHVDVHGGIGPRDALRLIRRLAEGLAKAHARGVTHRDLSPDNVMLRDDDLNHPVLIDFGIARAADMGEGVLAGRFAGKFKYIAPEQLGHFGGEVGPRADIYGMALMIAAVLRGRPIDMGASPEEASAARRTIPDLTGVPHEVFPLLQYMLEPDPADRPDSMDEVAAMAADPLRVPVRYRHPLWGAGQALTAAAAERRAALTEGLSPERPLVTEPRRDPAPDEAPRRARWPWGLAAAAVLAGGLWFAWRPDPAPVAPPPPVETAAPPPLPGRDAGTRDGFLGGADLPACTRVARIVSGPDSGQLSLLADGRRDLEAVRAGYDAAFGARPAVVEQVVTAAQCPVVDLLRSLQGRAEPAPVLTLDRDAVAAGQSLTGRLRETRGRAVWLFLVDPAGGVQDLSPRLNAQPDGTLTFALTLGAAEAPAPYLIVALASREGLLAPAAAPATAQAATLMPRALDEIARGGGLAAADAGWFLALPSAGQ